MFVLKGGIGRAFLTDEMPLTQKGKLENKSHFLQ